MKPYFEENGGMYTQVGEYPIPERPEGEIGIRRQPQTIPHTEKKKRRSSPMAEDKPFFLQRRR